MSSNSHVDALRDILILDERNALSGHSLGPLARHVVEGAIEEIVRQEDALNLESKKLSFIIADNASLRHAGLDLVAAAVFVIKNCDGLHRLAHAASEFIKAISKEGGRESKD